MFLSSIFQVCTDVNNIVDTVGHGIAQSQALKIDYYLNIRTVRISEMASEFCWDIECNLSKGMTLIKHFFITPNYLVRVDIPVRLINQNVDKPEFQD